MSLLFYPSLKNITTKSNCHEISNPLNFDVLGSVGRRYDIYGPTDHRHIETPPDASSLTPPNAYPHLGPQIIDT